MAIRATTFTVVWTPNTNVPHRVCWRVVGEPTYNCTTDGTHPNCGLSPCSYDVPINVDDETCDQIDYEGYVQATCEEEGSLAGRIPFAFSFVPDPACNRYEVICENSAVGSIIITDGADGYDPLPTPPPNVAFAGGGGVGAAATAVVGTGIISALAINNAGAGYSDGAYVGVSLTGGSGAGATADVTIAGGVVTVATINAGGSGYQDTDVLALDTGVVGVPGTPVELGPTTDYGIIIDITLDNGGSGYTSAPTIVIDASPTGTATATAVLAGCPELTISDCSGASAEAIPAGTYQPGESTFMCGETVPTIPDEFSVAENGNCLCNCQAYTIENTGGGPDTVDAWWIDCNGNVQTASLAPGGGPTNITCAVVDSISYVENGAGATMTITPGAACDGVAP